MPKKIREANPQTREVVCLCVFLVLLVFVVFGQTARFGFVNYDDQMYVYENPVVQAGLTLKGVAWAFTYGEIGHWHPLTWLTHMADCQVYGLWAGGHHLTNVALHAVCAVLLFLMLRDLTGKLWRGAFVAAVFAVHPLRVESVAWIAERKDVLSGVFFVLTLWAYVRYTRRPSPGRYVVVALWFALGLLSKNTLVTLPFVLLLLDWWPLNRLTSAASGSLGAVLCKLVKEKIPLFLLSAASCVATALVPEKMSAYYALPFWARLEVAVVSYATYLRQMVFPSGLANPYPNPVTALPLGEVALALALLAAVSAWAYVGRNKSPYLLTGWLWYLGMLVPMIGIVQISYYAHADRYTYLPQIGVCLMLTWAVADWCARWSGARWVLGGSSVAILAALVFCARIQASYWRDGESLWTHTLACTSRNFAAHYNLGYALFEEGRLDEAIGHYQQALQIEPGSAKARNNYGNALWQKGKFDDATAEYRQALQLQPDFAEAHNDFANALCQKGQTDQAIAECGRALQLKTNFAEAHNNLGNALLQKGRTDDAIAHYQQALQIKPRFPEAQAGLGRALCQTGRIDEGIAHYQQALQLKPGFAEVRNDLGFALVQTGKIDEGVAQYHLALQSQPDLAEAHYNLANVLLRGGLPEEAVAHYQQAVQIKPDYLEALNNLAWVLSKGPQASLRNGKQAVQLAERANQLTGNSNPDVLGTLASAYAEAGRFSEAVDSAQRALQLAGARHNTVLADALRSQLKFYQAGQPFHVQ